MYEMTINKVIKAADAKIELYQSKLRFFVASVLAGAYVGFGILLIFTISGLLVNSSANKIVMGASFGVALSLVIMAGSELFTGNNLVMTVGSLNKTTRLSDTIGSWLVCYVGNLVGALFVAILFVYAGLGGETPAGSALASAAVAKASVPALQLVFRGILCNILVCLAVLCSIKLENEVAKLIMIWWCLFVFITVGFEHSIANMTVYLTALIAGSTEVTISMMMYNLFFVTIGNMIGGILLGAAYYYLGNNQHS